jgi:hypothetical protein
MEPPKRHASNCKWARPTLDEPAPLWLAAEQAPWTCERDREPHALESTDVCEDCPRWQPKDPAGS